MKFAKTMQGPFGQCHVTSQIVGFPTSYRFRSIPPPAVSPQKIGHPQIQQFCANRLAAFRFQYESYFSAITISLMEHSAYFSVSKDSGG